MAAGCKTIGHVADMEQRTDGGATRLPVISNHNGGQNDRYPRVITEKIMKLIIAAVFSCIFAQVKNRDIKYLSRDKGFSDPLK